MTPDPQGPALLDVVVTRILARLNDDPPAGMPATFLERLFDFETHELPSSDLFVVREKVSKPRELGAAPPVRLRDLELQFECRAAAKEGVSARTSLSPIRNWLVQRLCAPQALGTDRLVIAVEETGTEFVYEGEDLSYCTAVVQFTVTYLARVDDPTTRT